MNPNNDWKFEKDGLLYSFRSAGVLIYGGKLLIRCGIPNTECALPGGAVRYGELSAQTVVREFGEETGAQVSAERLIWVAESFWRPRGQNRHSVCHYYLMKLMDPIRIPLTGTFGSLDNAGSRRIFSWIPEA